MNDFTLPTVINSIERLMVKFLFETVVFKFSLFDRNSQNKHKNSECNYAIGFFNLKTNNSGRYNRFSYLNET